MVSSGVAIPPKTPTSSTPAVELERKMTHALVSPDPGEFEVDGKVVTEVEEGRKWGSQSPPVERLSVESFKVTELAVTTPVPPTTVHEPPDTELAAGAAAAAACVKVSPAPEELPSPDPLVANGPVWVATKAPRTTAIITTTTTPMT